jgi:predicted phage terminase large subunit-like protein
MNKWEVVIEKAIRADGSLLFPQKLSHEFLEEQKRSMGSYLFANQYLNEVIPIELQTFKKNWFRYYESLPKNKTTFVFIDPALSESDTSDYTGVVVVHLDHDKNWYVEYARRHRVRPTELIDLVFKLYDQLAPNVIGIEDVAYQKALLYFLDEEMRRRGKIMPIKGITPPNNKTKQMRIQSLVPRLEWGHLFLARGLVDLELELLSFPRGKYDDLIDALASIEYIQYAPEKEQQWKTPPHPGHPDYERWYIQKKLGRLNQ